MGRGAERLGIRKLAVANCWKSVSGEMLVCEIGKDGRGARGKNSG